MQMIAMERRKMIDTRAEAEEWKSTNFHCNCGWCEFFKTFMTQKLLDDLLYKGHIDLEKWKEIKEEYIND